MRLSVGGDKEVERVKRVMEKKLILTKNLNLIWTIN